MRGMNMTTSKELVISALHREEVDRIPFCPPFQGYWALGYSNVGTLQSIEDPKAAAEAQFRVIDDCHIDGVETMWDWLIPVEAMGCEVRIPQSGTIPTMEHIIHDANDLEKLAVPEFKDVKDFYRFAGARETTRIMADRIGKDHYLMASLLAPFTLAGELRGVEDMMMDCLMEEDFIHALVEKSAEIDTVFAEDIASWDIDALILCDPTCSGDLVCGDDYAKFSKAVTKKMGDMARSKGKDVITHICGDTTDRIGYVADTGAIAFSVDWQVDIGKAVKDMENRMAMIGNINPAAYLFSGTPDQVREETRRIAESGGKKGFLMGSGCDIPVGSDYANVKAISEILMNL